MAENDASRVALGAVPGTVPGVVRKACPKAFLAATCRSILVVKGNEICGSARNEVLRTNRRASRNATCRGRGKVIVMVTRKGNSGVACGGTSDATGAVTVMGFGTRAGKTGRQFLGAPEPALSEPGRDSSEDLGMTDGEPNGSDSARYSSIWAVQSPFSAERHGGHVADVTALGRGSAAGPRPLPSCVGRYSVTGTSAAWCGGSHG